MHHMVTTVSCSRGFRDLNPARRVEFFFSAFVDRLTNYISKFTLYLSTAFGLVAKGKAKKLSKNIYFKEKSL
jgi:hypothetical protein